MNKQMEFMNFEYLSIHFFSPTNVQAAAEVSVPWIRIPPIKTGMSLQHLNIT